MTTANWDPLRRIERPAPGLECEKCGAAVYSTTNSLCRGCHAAQNPAPESGGVIGLEEMKHRGLRLDAALGLLADDQLQAECERRGWYMGAALMSDDQLRAEFERRRLDEDQFEWTSECHGCHAVGRFDTEQARDVYDHEHEASCQFSVTAWKRRAEAAEAANAARPRFTATVPFSAELTRRTESGPGIAATDVVRKHFRDEPLAHLPEDLLCEDA
jgi:hypothetical protein